MAPKRQKLEQVINPEILEPAFRDTLRDSIRASKPYKHGVIQNLISDEVLRAARDEIMSNIHFTTKETDIYKVNQTGDLANLQGLDQSEQQLLKSLGRVRDALYSEEFRNFMSHTTDCGPLSGSKQDLSINLYNKGCHLLNHDDVIGTRRVSYILYLTPPDDPWQPKWGGGLRLFPTIKPGIPETDWSRSIPPQWNQMAYFKVQPGHSFHDVEEVYVEKERLSISGWFHAPQKGENGYTEEEEEEKTDLDKATLAQLETLTEDPEFEPKVALERNSLSSEEESINYLSRFIKKDILDNIDTLNEQFSDESMIQIPDFLNKEYYQTVKEAIEVDDLAKVPKTSKDVQEPWKVAKPPHIHRYMYIDDTDHVPATEDLAAHTKLNELRAMFSSSEFLWFLSRLTGLEPNSCQSLARRFRPGQDFTLATVSGRQENILEAVLCVTPSVWNDDVGGYDLIMAPDVTADAGEADPAVYRSGGDSTILLTSIPASNEFTLVYREPGLLRFIKYVSRGAAGSRWDITASYGLNEEEEEEGEGEVIKDENDSEVENCEENEKSLLEV